MKLEGVSIIICCHNGADRLPETVWHIARQQVPWYIPWELLIIDNGSTDGSAAVARSQWQKHATEVPMRIVQEPVLGLSHARVRGFREARYEYIIMCDDDNWLEDRYVATAFQIMSSKPRIGAMGGFGKLCFEREPEVAELTYIFAAGPQAAHSGKANENRVHGAGCVIRYEAYHKLIASGFRSLLTDRRGLELTSGGDYELCLGLAILGYEVWYDERLRFTHFITRERLTWDYLTRYACESSKSFNVITSYKLVASNAAVNRFPALAVFRSFLVSLKGFLQTTLKRITRPAYQQRSLHFAHMVFAYKLRAYFSSFPSMVKTHRTIVDFSRRCRSSQEVLKPATDKGYLWSFRLSFFSRPFRLLP